jgi:uncharacterized protein YyaL (SSP411 family)
LQVVLRRCTSAAETITESGKLLMTNARHHRWTVWLAGALAIAGAGILGGWMLGDHDEQAALDEPAQHAEQIPVAAQTEPSGPLRQAEPRKSAAPDRQQTQPEKPTHVNRLANESSLYLQLHKHNPIDWFPWGPEAFDKAKREDKMIFLSIGYSSCHWCHVMERESFNDAEIAETLNESFVCIKVDREELPDVDDVYMNALMQMQRSGGWPLTMFLTPDRKPITGGTYYPPRARGGMIGLDELLRRILTAWHENREDVERSADHWAAAVRRDSTPRGFTFRKLDREVVHSGVEQLAGIFDQQHGGFGFDPRNPRRAKFPQPSCLSLLLYHLRESKAERPGAMLTLTLDRMARGGIWDLLGGGFHRYSTDRFWQVPHFEKMLYDNAQLARVYLEAFELTQDRNYRYIATSIFKFVADEMTSDEGAFYSALDADTDHEEGKFYAWTKEEVEQILTPHEFRLFGSVNGLMGPPNFEEQYVLQPVDALPEIATRMKISIGDLSGLLEPAAKKLIEARKKRERPLTDTKVMTDWNGLMIAALADGYRILKNEAYLQSAERAATLILTKVRDENGRLLHVYAGGKAKIPAYLDDHAFFLEGLLALHRATKDDRWLDESRRVADQMIEWFWDESNGGFFHTPSDQAVVLARTKPIDDKAIPAGNSSAVRALVELARNTGDKRYAEFAGRTLSAFAGMLATSPGEYPYMARGLGEYHDGGFPPSLLTARPPTREPEVVRARAQVSHDKLQRGKTFQIRVEFIVDSEWHIYANPASRPEYVATTLQVTSATPIEAVKVQYPDSSKFRTEGIAEPIDVYSGRQNLIKVSARVGDDAATGKSELKLALRYQACNDHQCLAPKTLQIILPVVVAEDGESVTELFSDLFGEAGDQ